MIICPKNSLNPARGTLSAAAIVEKNQGHPDDGLEGCDTLEAYGQVKVKKWPLYCPQGSGTLRQQLLMMHGIEWYCMVLHCIA